MNQDEQLTSVKLPRELYKKMKIAMIENDITFSDFISKSITYFLETGSFKQQFITPISGSNL